MDSLKTLIEKRQFQLVLDLTANTRGASDIPYRISAYIGLGKLDEALRLIKQYQGKFEDATFNIMKVHLEMLMTLNKYDIAYQELKYYQNLPYISQEVEEFLNGAEGMIRTHERNFQRIKRKSKEEIIEILEKETDSLILLSALTEIRNYNINDFSTHLIKLMARENINSFVGIYPLFLLVSGGYAQPLSLTKNGKLYTVVPKDLEPPFVNQNYEKVVALIEEVAKDPSLSEVAVSLFNELIIILYPENIFDESINLLSGALLAIAYDHFQIPRHDAALAEGLGVDEGDLKDLARKFKQLLIENPPIKAVK
jgi:hypothetical protein